MNSEIKFCKMKRSHKAFCRLCGTSKAFTQYLEITGRKSICFHCKQTLYNSSFNMYIKILSK